MNRNEPIAGEVYRHFKGTLYRVVCVAKHTESDERLVIYTKNDTEGETVYARPVEMFLSEIDKAKYPTSKAKYRFTLVEQDNKCDFNEVSDSVNGVNDEIDYDNMEANLNPLLEAFLDASSYEAKLDKFYDMRGKVDMKILSDVAMSLDLELTKDNVDDQYVEILNCLRTMEKYECNRLRP